MVTYMGPTPESLKRKLAPPSGSGEFAEVKQMSKHDQRSIPCYPVTLVEYTKIPGPNFQRYLPN